MTDQQITVDQLIEVARTMSSTETLRRKLEKFAAQQRADAVQQLQRESAEAKKYCLQAGDDLRAARAVIKSRENMLIDSQDEAEKLRAELAAAKQRIADAEKDAARYRWLRDQHKKHLGLTICKVGMWDLTPWSGDDPDSAIDAARTAQAGEKQG